MEHIKLVCELGTVLSLFGVWFKILNLDPKSSQDFWEKKPLVIKTEVGVGPRLNNQYTCHE